MTNDEEVLLIEAIRSAKSPKMALDGAKLMFQGDPSISHVSREVFNEAWDDATRMNRLIERKSGKVRWPNRLDLNEERIRHEVNRYSSSNNKGEILGRILSELDEKGLLLFKESIKGL